MFKVFLWSPTKEVIEVTFCFLEITIARPSTVACNGRDLTMALRFVRLIPVAEWLRATAAKGVSDCLRDAGSEGPEAIARHVTSGCTGRRC